MSIMIEENFPVRRLRDVLVAGLNLLKGRDLERQET